MAVHPLTLRSPQEPANMRTIAVIDIDNTLWQFSDPFYEELQRLNGPVPPTEQWTSAHFWEPYLSEQQFMDAINAIHHRQDSEKFRPYPEAQRFLRTLQEQGYRVVIASH